MAQRDYDYNQLVHTALIGVVRNVLSDAAENGLPGQHHFYVTFATAAPGVELPDYLRVQYPEEMPLIIQHQFWGLEVGDDVFEVTLSFKGVHERLRVPYDAITTFADPSVNFVLRLGLVESADGDEGASELPDTDDSPMGAADAGAGDGTNVVSIETFRKG